MGGDLLAASIIEKIDDAAWTVPIIIENSSALFLSVREAWRQWWILNGVTDEACPMDGVFEVVGA